MLSYGLALFVASIFILTLTLTLTMNTLKFAQRMKQVKNKKARTNVSSQRIASMKRELSKLQALLKTNDKVDELRKNEKS